MALENLGTPPSNVIQIIHIPCSVQEIWKYKIESTFLIHAVLFVILEPCVTKCN